MKRFFSFIHGNRGFAYSIFPDSCNPVCLISRTACALACSPVCPACLTDVNASDVYPVTLVFEYFSPRIVAMSSSRRAKGDKESSSVQDRLQLLLTRLLKDDDNKYCVDCDAKGEGNSIVEHHLEAFALWPFVQRLSSFPRKEV